jgi:hypothetical protein
VRPRGLAHVLHKKVGDAMDDFSLLRSITQPAEP